MMGVRRRRLGKFGIGHRVASASAIAILAVSLAIVPMTGPHLDGVGRAIAEAVLGDPVSAQEPPADSLVQCLERAEDALRACLDSTPWYLEIRCWVPQWARQAACFIGARD